MKRKLIFLILLIRGIAFAVLDDYTLKNKVEHNNIRALQELRVTTLDPIKLNDIYSKRAFLYIYETLFEIDDDEVIHKKLVSDYRYINSKNLYIKLRDNIKFQDGSLLTAKDVKYSLMRMKKKGALKEFYSNIQDIEVLNSSELIIRLNTEEKYLFKLLSHSMSSIIKEKDGKLFGTGEYQVKSFDKDQIVLSDNNKEKTFTIERVFSTKERLLALFNENADIVYDINDYNIIKGKRLEIINEDKIEIKASDNIVTLALIFGKERELKFKKVIQSSIKDKTENILPPEIYGENFKVQEFNLSKDEMKLYVDSLKKENRKIELMILNTEEDRALAKKIESDLKNNGIEIKITPYQVDAFYYKLKNKDYDIALQHLVFNKKFPQISLGKVILYDIYDRNLYNSFSLIKAQLGIDKGLKKNNSTFIRDINNIFNKIPYIPIKHQALYILHNKEIGEEKIKK
ncbi:MAG: ABC transporter substrate-binding protein [Fusobacterium sp.]|nr:ABC transporter substrate-binding protein [Fusobacterium sp.]MDO5788709.1 ABC transporter substrate-binding protein [Fusobacterium sp.]